MQTIELEMHAMHGHHSLIDRHKLPAKQQAAKQSSSMKPKKDFFKYPSGWAVFGSSICRTARSFARVTKSWRPRNQCTRCSNNKD